MSEELGKHCDRIPASPLGNDVSLMATNLEAMLSSPSYVLADDDHELLERQEMRGVRMMLELQKPEMALQEEKIHSTVIVFGGTQIIEHSAAQRRLTEAQKTAAAKPGDTAAAREVARSEQLVSLSHYYDEAREFARLVSIDHQCETRREFVIVTGGGPGVMEAANRGAFDVGCKSIGLNIRLPSEQHPNPFITPELCFQFRYFAIRKFHFILRAAGVVLFPGGFGTLDELFEALTLRQTHRMQPAPIVLYGRDYWKSVIDFRKLADYGVISDAHLDLFTYADTPEAAWRTIVDFNERQRKAEEHQPPPFTSREDELNP